jgi:DNA polymerase III epsilon subunit-like protein
MAEPPTETEPATPIHTLDDVALLMRSFLSDGDAFFFMGGSTMAEVEARIEKLRIGSQPLLRPPLPRRPPISLETAAMPPPPPPPPAPPSRPPLTLPDGHKPLLVFDTETTGLKPAIVCQLAYMVIEDGNITSEYDQLLKLPAGVRIGKQAQAVHGISTKDCATRGVDAPEALDAFARECSRILSAGGRVVAHNTKFDVRAIRETRLAHNVIDHSENQTIEDSDTFCTMAMSKGYSPLTDRAGRRKAFRNEELYFYFFGSPPSWARLHNALDDVSVTALNYSAGLGRGWW